MYMKGEMTGVGELSGAKFLMALVMGKGLGTVSEVSGCSEKSGDHVQVRDSRKTSFFFTSLQPFHLSCISCQIPAKVWDIHSIPGSVDFLSFQCKQNGTGFSPDCPAVGNHLPTVFQNSPSTCLT